MKTILFVLGLPETNCSGFYTWYVFVLDSPARTALVCDVIHTLSPKPRLSSTNPKRRKNEIALHLTSTPNKDKLINKKRTEKKKTTKSSTRTKLPFKEYMQSKENKGRCANHDKGSCSSEDEEWPCLICAEPFSNSRAKEVWVRCIICQKWAHEDCTKGEFIFICPNCESDDALND